MVTKKESDQLYLAYLMRADHLQTTGEMFVLAIQFIQLKKLMREFAEYVKRESKDMPVA